MDLDFKLIRVYLTSEKWKLRHNIRSRSAYFEPCQTWGIPRTPENLWGELCNYNYRLKAVKYCCKALHLTRLQEVWIWFCKSSLLVITGANSGLRQFLAIESHFKMMKNTFIFTLRSLFILKIFKFLSWLFGQVEKRYD